MQKISSYLYPNRINVVADVDLLPVRWKIVYQNRIKIYQGVDNVLTVDVKNSDQKRIDISAMDLHLTVTDTAGLLVTDVPLVPSATQGLATAVIPETALTVLDPQFLQFSIYRVNQDDTKTVLYADTNFGAFGNMELIRSVTGVATHEKYITRFAPVTDPSVLQTPPYVIRYYSDAVEILQPNYVNAPEDDAISFKFELTGLEGEIKVQFTKDATISSDAAAWVDIDTFDVTPATTAQIQTYTPSNGYSREYTWARVIYTPVEENTGKVDRVIITL